VNHPNLYGKNIDKIKWKYLMNFASTEFPLRSNYELTKIMKLYNGANDIRSDYSIAIPGRFEYVYALFDDPKRGKIVAKTDKLKGPVPHNITVSKGYANGLFNRNFIEFALNNKYAQDFIEWSKDSYIPDEM
jgi:hypothetical protein